MPTKRARNDWFLFNPQTGKNGKLSIFPKFPKVKKEIKVTKEILDSKANEDYKAKKVIRATKEIEEKRAKKVIPESQTNIWPTSVFIRQSYSGREQEEPVPLR